MSSVKISLKVFEILILGSNHPTELIMPLLNKLTKDGMLRLDISP